MILRTIVGTFLKLWLASSDFLWTFLLMQRSEAATRRCSSKKMFWKYVANLQENTHAEVWFQTSAWVFSCKFAAYFQNTIY